MSKHAIELPSGPCHDAAYGLAGWCIYVSVIRGRSGLQAWHHPRTLCLVSLMAILRSVPSLKACFKHNLQTQQVALCGFRRLAEMGKIVSVGEALIELIPAAQQGSECPVLRVIPAGGPLRVAAEVARLGHSSGFMGGLSNDGMGDYLAGWLEQHGIATDYTSRIDAPTPMALTDGILPPIPHGATADRLFDPSGVQSLGEDVVALHMGSLSLARDPLAGRLETLARNQGATRVISLDLDIRPAAIEAPTACRARLHRLAALASIVKASVADLDWLAPTSAPADVAHEWLDRGAGLVIITRGRLGTIAYGHRASLDCPTEGVVTARTSGAGAVFIAGLLVSLQSGDALSPSAIRTLDAAALGYHLTTAQEIVTKRFS